MTDILQFTALALITTFAAAAAVAFNWVLLRTMFVLMRPATAGRLPVRTSLAQGTTQLARVFVANR